MAAFAVFDGNDISNPVTQQNRASPVEVAHKKQAGRSIKGRLTGFDIDNLEVELFGRGDMPGAQFDALHGRGLQSR